MPVGAQTITIPDNAIPGQKLMSVPGDATETKITVKRAPKDFIDRTLMLQMSAACRYSTILGDLDGIDLAAGQTVEFLSPGGVDRIFYVTFAGGPATVRPYVSK